MSKVNDGGAAFPMPAGASAYDGRPQYSHGNAPGMSLRDYFAGQALQGMLASGCQEAVEQVWIATGRSAAGGLATAAYGFADAMLAARKAGAQ